MLVYFHIGNKEPRYLYQEGFGPHCNGTLRAAYLFHVLYVRCRVWEAELGSHLRRPPSPTDPIHEDHISFQWRGILQWQYMQCKTPELKTGHVIDVFKNSGLVVDQTLKGGFRFWNIEKTEIEGATEIHDGDKASSNDINKAWCLVCWRDLIVYHEFEHGTKWESIFMLDYTEVREQAIRSTICKTWGDFAFGQQYTLNWFR